MKKRVNNHYVIIWKKILVYFTDHSIKYRREWTIDICMIYLTGVVCAQLYKSSNIV